jgi:hypothetical protein
MGLLGGPQLHQVVGTPWHDFLGYRMAGHLPRLTGAAVGLLSLFDRIRGSLAARAVESLLAANFRFQSCCSRRCEGRDDDWMRAFVKPRRHNN